MSTSATVEKIRIRPKSCANRNLVFHPNQLSKVLVPYLKGKENIQVLCIGTDRATGDCFGPLVGTYLSRSNSKYGFDFYGTLQSPVMALNVEDTWATIKNNGYTIAIDACFGDRDNVNTLSVREGSMEPGSAMNKGLGRVGDMVIAGVVNVGGYMEHMVLCNTSLHYVETMSRYVAQELIITARKLQYLKRLEETKYSGK